LVNSVDLIAVEDIPTANLVRAPKPVPDPDTPVQFLPNGTPVPAQRDTSQIPD
jgi:putative transposase